MSGDDLSKLSLGDWASGGAEPTAEPAARTGPGPDHVMESPVFRARVPGIWQRQALQGAPMGNAAFIHPAFGFSLFQTVVAPDPGERADTVEFVRRAMSARLQSLEDNGHRVTPGRVAFTKKDFGPVGICDCTLDDVRYGVMVGYGFAEVALIHFMDGDTGQEPAVKHNVQLLLDTVERVAPLA